VARWADHLRVFSGIAIRRAATAIREFAMTRLMLAIIALCAFTACNNPFADKCMCTAMECSEGVSIKLENYPDSTLNSDFSVSIAYGDTIEAASELWSSIQSGEFYFSSRRLLRQKPKQIGIRISYSKSGLEKSASLDTAITWATFVCNSCSGSSPSCKDDMNYMARVKIDLIQSLVSNP
jgi:hypothetical protein